MELFTTATTPTAPVVKSATLLLFPPPPLERARAGGGGVVAHHDDRPRRDERRRRRRIDQLDPRVLTEEFQVVELPLDAVDGDREGVLQRGRQVPHGRNDGLVEGQSDGSAGRGHGRGRERGRGRVHRGLVVDFGNPAPAGGEVGDLLVVGVLKGLAAGVGLVVADDDGIALPDQARHGERHHILETAEARNLAGRAVDGDAERVVPEGARVGRVVQVLAERQRDGASVRRYLGAGHIGRAGVRAVDADLEDSCSG